MSSRKPRQIYLLQEIETALTENVTNLPVIVTALQECVIILNIARSVSCYKKSGQRFACCQGLTGVFHVINDLSMFYKSSRTRSCFHVNQDCSCLTCYQIRVLHMTNDGFMFYILPRSVLRLNYYQMVYVSHVIQFYQ